MSSSNQCKIYCVDGYGNSKKAYPTELLAQQTANYENKERGIKLKVYKCVYGNGYHLTKA
jgi:hypothetical protein